MGDYNLPYLCAQFSLKLLQLHIFFKLLSPNEFLCPSIFKRPARDACLCMGELPAPAAPPAPHFVFLITL